MKKVIVLCLASIAGMCEMSIHTPSLVLSIAGVLFAALMPPIGGICATEGIVYLASSDENFNAKYNYRV